MLKKTQSTLIDGSAGALEVRFNQSESPQPPGLVVISHPHPQFGGSMDNKVVTTIEKVFSQAHYPTLCYNFRGVGQSQGEYDAGEGEQQDLVAAVTWALEQVGNLPLTLAGFSFGSFISLKQANQLSASRLITVAPPVGLYDFSRITVDKAVAWSLVQGGQDEVVSADEVMAWLRGLDHRPDVYWREHASHFFHGELIWLRKALHCAVC